MTTPEIDRDAHSIIGGSVCKQYRRDACPGSVNLRRAILEKEGPDPGSDYAREGTRLHALMEHCLRSGDYSADAFHGGWLEDEKALEVAPFTHAQIAAVNVVLAHVAELMKLPGAVLYVETKFHLADIDKRAFGRADVVVVWDDGVEIVDAKFGVGIPVEVEDNDQQLYYAAGVRRAIPEVNSKLDLRLHIAQPRLSPMHPDGPIRSWPTDMFALLAWESELAEDIKATDDPNAPRRAGDHCQFCPGTKIDPATGRYKCDAYDARTAGARDEAFAIVEDPVSLAAMTAEDLGRIYSRLSILRKYIEDVTAFVKMKARTTPPAGYCWKPGNRNWDWKGTPGEVLGYVRMMHGDEKADALASLVTPIQAEKTLGRDAFAELAQFVDKKPPAPQLTKKGPKTVELPLADVQAYFSRNHDAAFPVIE